MSSMGELTFFLGLLVKQKPDGIFISHDKYVAEILKKFGLTDGKSASTAIDAEKPLLKDPDSEDVDVHIYRSMIDQMVFGKDSSNSLMADNLPKIVWYSTHHVALMKSWLVQKQTALGVMDEEMKSIKVNKVWIVVDRHPNAKIVRNKWLYKKKTDMDGKVLKDKGFDFLSHCKIRIGNGASTRFWSDVWIMDTPLSVRFPQLYALENDIDVSVAEKWHASSLDMSFRRPTKDGLEKTQWDDLVSMIGPPSTIYFSPIRVLLLGGCAIFRSKLIFSPGVLGWTGCRLEIGINGSTLSFCSLSLKICWRVSSIRRGGTYGGFGIELFSMFSSLSVL
nr:hypothetical protein [Tanacetum cinerariifolium]